MNLRELWSDRQPTFGAWLGVASPVSAEATARVGFDWSEIREVVAKVEEELRETREAIAAQDPDAIAEEMGDLLFAVVNLVRKNKLDAETVLAAATEKFIARFHTLERELEKEGRKLGEVDLAGLDEIWNRVKNVAPAA